MKLFLSTLSRAHGTVFLICLLLLVFSGAVSPARTFKVNNAYDVDDLNPGDGLCVAYLIIIPPYVIPFCTLRGAISEANSYPGEDVVQLPAGIYTLSSLGRNEDGNEQGDLDVSESLILEGQGEQLTVIDAKSIDRVVDVVSEDVHFVLKNLTLINGRALNEGGAIHNSGKLEVEHVVILDSRVANENGRGGAIYNQNDLEIRYATLTAGSAEYGGGLYSEQGANVEISMTTISNNSGLYGGGLFNLGDMWMTNVTVSGNGSLQTLSGGGVENRGRLFMQYITVSDNTASRGGGFENFGEITLQNSIVAQNFGGECGTKGVVLSYGYNIDGDKSCGLTHLSDVSGVHAGLLPLTNNGGNAKTHALSYSSPARDSGCSVGSVVVDQRGIARPFGKEVDRGAFEYNRSTLPPSLMLIFR